MQYWEGNFQSHRPVDSLDVDPFKSNVKLGSALDI
jgi:hypothetical protein